MDDIGSRLESLRERIARAAERAGRTASQVRLMAVSKFRPGADIRAAYAAGQRLFGESRVQEAMAKRASDFSVLPGAELHMIVRLQSNKARAAAETFDCVQSLDSARLAGILGGACRAAGKDMPVFLELHTGEESKAGFRSPDELWEALDAIASEADASGDEAGGLKPIGLMTMAPYTDDPAPIRASFRALAAAGAEWARRRPELGRPLLSMGMSNDFEIAVEEGSDMLRIGSLIFGGPA